MRDQLVSITKGIGIVLMVVGHSGCPEFLHDYIYMFHMPLFFIMAGWCFKDSCLESIPKYIYKKIKGLYIPYVAVSLSFLLLHNTFVRFHLETGTIYNFKDILDISKSIIISLHKHEQLLGAMWFVPQLFYSSIIAVTLVKFVKNKIVLLFCLLAVTILSQEYAFGVPYTGVGHVTFFAAVFYLTGSLLAKHTNLCRINPYITCFMAIAVYVASVIYPSSIFIDSPRWVIPYFCVAIIGTLVIINISVIIKESENKPIQRLKGALSYLGDNSIYLLVFHFLAFKAVSFLFVKLLALPITSMSDFPVLEGMQIKGLWLMYSIAGLLIPVLLCMLYQGVKKYLFLKRHKAMANVK